MLVGETHAFIKRADGSVKKAVSRIRDPVDGVVEVVEEEG